VTAAGAGPRTLVTHPVPGLYAVPLVPGGPVAIEGAIEIEQVDEGLRIHRLARDARRQLPHDFMRLAAMQPAGVRLAFRSAARRVELDVRAHRAPRDAGAEVPGRSAVGQPAGAGIYDLVVDGELLGRGFAPESGSLLLDDATKTARVLPAPITTVVFDALPGREADIEIWLPTLELTTLVAMRADRPVHHVRERPRRRWLHHGSSISHGVDAESPTATWPAVAARLADLDLTNLGFSGNAMVDPFVARTIRDQPADLISVKLGINVVNRDAMRRRAFGPAIEGFLDTIRDGHPATPLVVISPILCPLVEDRPGPTEQDPDSPPGAALFRTRGRPDELAEDKLSLQLIREILDGIVASRRDAGDDALTYLDGLTLYGWQEWATMPLPDLLHPDTAGHRHIGERFASWVSARQVTGGEP
jgi:GDSL-like Lipase/Acylhydrolase family